MRQEYKEIEKLFFESMPSTVCIDSIERVENGELWDNFIRYLMVNHHTTIMLLLLKKREQKYSSLVN